ncbi:phospholipase D-like domain-containing protein [Wolbachia endosymbiont (group B) of Melanostoma mellinum]|uniref:phospholipase D-like domain-containing protein n=2 Tax=Wolbachia endosymbiont (group B) of Melanostoma mellinum TaxID=2954030 RepID=UPI003877CB33
MAGIMPLMPPPSTERIYLIMFRYLIILLTCSLLSGCVSCPSTTVCFTPRENCTNLIIDSVDHAKKSVLVQAYQFTSKPIAESLVQAKKRGVDVMVILDESQVSSKYSVINELFHQKIPIYIDYKPCILKKASNVLSLSISWRREEL